MDGVGARNNRPPRTSSRARPTSADRASDTRRGLSKPSSRERPNRRREVHYNSEAEATATLAAAETAPPKQAKAPKAPLAGRAKLPKPRAWRRGAGGEAGERAGRSARASEARSSASGGLIRQTKKAAGEAAFLKWVFLWCCCYWTC